ncbi:hypothetical protein CISIN_1g035028mg [Citrus sinensis]|uniref:Uncharacterized protein n=1 Tax=Citrus sinensis TaxID=2711 RepID=A0A067E0I2_CITSI|nr:hypothetical protein CISIN_1g035028mg [Citrus sinensis]
MISPWCSTVFRLLLEHGHYYFRLSLGTRRFLSRAILLANLFRLPWLPAQIGFLRVIFLFILFDAAENKINALCEY